MAQLGKLIKHIAGAARANVWFLQGAEPHSGRPLKVLFAGGDKQKEYVAQLVFNSGCRETWAGKRYLPRIRWLLRHGGCAMAFIEGRRIQRWLYQTGRDFFVPLWLESCVEIPLQAPTKGAKEDLRRIRKHRLWYELRSDADALSDFYRNMYLPTIRDRHEKTAVSAGFAEFEQMLGRPGNVLLLVRQGETAIAGVVIQMQEIPRLWVAGIRDSSDAYRRMGAVGATYHFPAQYLAEQGYRQMAFGRSRAFLNDGVMRYKRKWNHRLSGCDRDGLVLKPLAASEALAGFLVNQPFVSVSNGELQANLFTGDPDQPDRVLSQQMAELCACRGLAGTRVFALDTVKGRIRRLREADR